MSGNERLLEERWSRVSVRVIEGEEVRKDDPLKYFLSAGVGSNS